MLIKALSIRANFKDGFNSTQLEADIDEVLKQYSLTFASEYNLRSPASFQVCGRFYVAEQSRYEDFVRWSSAFTLLSKNMPSAHCFTAAVTVYHWEKTKIPEIRGDLTACFASQRANLAVPKGFKDPTILVDTIETIVRPH